MLKVEKTSKDLIKERGKFTIKMKESEDSIYIISTAGDIAILPVTSSAVKIKIKIRKKVID